MYIPAFFSTAANGCPSGYNAYNLANCSYTNLNSGARSKQITNWNEFTNTIVGENYQGSGSWNYAEVANSQTVTFNALIPPPLLYPDFISYANFGSQGNSVINYNITGSNGNDIIYCYDCTRKFRWTFESVAGLSSPWPLTSDPLTIAVLSSSNADPDNPSSYTRFTFDFTNGSTASVEGYGPPWQWNGPGGTSAPQYYITNRVDTTPRYYFVQNCATASVTASISMLNETPLTIGSVIRSSTSTLSGSCWSVSSSFQTASGFTPNISNVVTASTFNNCDDCGNTLKPLKYNIQNCITSQSYVVTFSGSYEPSTNTVFSSTLPSLTTECYTVTGLANWTSSVNHSNITTASLYASCDECITALLLTTQSLYSYIDVSKTFSYPGSGSTIYDIHGNNNATILSSSYWVYDTASLATPVLRLNTSSSNSSSVLFPSASVAPSSFTLLLTWYGVNPVYDGFYNYASLLFEKDQDPGNNQFGMIAKSAGDVGAVVVNGSQIGSTNVSGSANLNSWHISQVTLTNTGTGSYCVDGITGSYTGSTGGGTFADIEYSIFGNTLLQSNGGFGSGSMFQVAAIYTGSLTQQQMLNNYNALKNRYGL